MEALEILSSIIPRCWDILAFPLPGFAGYATLQDFIGAILMINIAFACLKMAFNIGTSTSYRSGQSDRKYISKERKGDVK